MKRNGDGRRQEFRPTVPGAASRQPNTPAAKCSLGGRE